MTTSQYLAGLIGVTLIILGPIFIARRAYFAGVFAEIADQDLLRSVAAIFELVAGIALVLAHNVWAPFPAAVVTFFGWLMVIEGTAYLVMPNAAVTHMIGILNKRALYVPAGVLAVLVGAYLTGFAFGLWA
ncbi:MAG: hypothetical protein AB7E79_13600 [Rhodospirillaceae bacterium]